MHGIEKAYGVLVGKPVGKRPLGTARCTWEDNTNKDLRGIGWNSMGWICLVKDRDHWWLL
jgi:hypothetical protein